MDCPSLPYQLTCDGQQHPLGIDHPHPVFDYIPACRQTAVRLCIVEEKTGGPVWDSGVRHTAFTQMVAEQPLRERTAYRWFVETADGEGRWTRSDTAHFETGIFGRRFAASFIHGGTLYRREFRVDTPIRRARAYFTALGYGELYINGQPASDAICSRRIPGTTSASNTPYTTLRPCCAADRMPWAYGRPPTGLWGQTGNARADARPVL